MDRCGGRNSVEELNQEIERLVLVEDAKVLEPTPEGHRAPIAELFANARRSVSTQTPYSLDDSDEWTEEEERDFCHNDFGDRGSDSALSLCSSPGSRCPSSMGHYFSPYGSPVHLIGYESGDKPYYQRSSKDYRHRSHSGVSKILTREPPDGCEKVKIISEETRRQNAAFSEAATAHFAPPCPKSGFILLPSQSSAFHVLPHTNYNLHTNNQLHYAGAAANQCSQQHLFTERLNELNMSD